MLIILEGADKMGKSTFARKFNNVDVYSGEKFLNAPADIHNTTMYVHQDKNSNMTVILTTAMWFSKRNLVILDRSIISELVYGPIFRGETKYSENEIMARLLHLKETTDYVILWFNRRNRSEYELELDKQDEFEADMTKVNQVARMYVNLMHTLKDWGFNIYEVSYL